MSSSQKKPLPQSYIELASIGHSSVGGGSIDDDSSNSIETSYAPISGNFHTDENGKTQISIVFLGVIKMPAITVQGGSAVEKGAKSFLGATNTVQTTVKTAVGSFFKNGASATVSSTKKVVEKLRSNARIQKIGGGVRTVVRATSNVVDGAISKFLPPKKTIQEQFEEENLGSGNYSNDDEAESDLYISDTDSVTGSDDEYDIIYADEALEGN